MNKIALNKLCKKGTSTLRQKDVVNDGPYPVYGASGIVGYSADYQNEERYVAVIKDGAGVGRVCACEPKSSVLGTMQALLPVEGVDCDYLLHLVRSMRLGDGFTGSTIPHIYFKDYGKRLLAEHNTGDQKRIAESLNTVEKHKAVLGQQSDGLDELVKSRFVEMFGDQKTNSLGLPTSKLGDVAFVGSSKRVFKDELVEGGVPFYRGTEVGALAFGERITPELFITRSHYQELVDHTGKPEIGDLLMPSICPDGQIWLVDTENPFYFKDGRVLWVKPDRSILNSTFLQYAMRDRFISDFESFASGTTFAELKIFVLKNLVVTVPQMEMQNEFAVFVQQVDKLKSSVQQQIDKLQLLYDSLAQEYFGGE